MGLGMQVFDASGNLVIDVTTRLTRVIGIVAIPAAGIGSISVPGSGRGTIWYALYGNGGNRYSPVVSVSGDTISWSPFGGFPGGPVDVRLVYGRY